MQGGEIFVPKIPSVRITDVVEAMSPGIAPRVIGIRPGEKLHEVMCPVDNAHQTIEFDDHFVISPAITFAFFSNYGSNSLGESGVPVADGFEYNSGTNPHFLSVREIRDWEAAHPGRRN